MRHMERFEVKIFTWEFAENFKIVVGHGFYKIR